MEDWGAIRARLTGLVEAFAGSTPELAADIRAALKRVEELDRQQEKLMDDIQSTGKLWHEAAAKLARCVEAMEQIVANLPPDWELVETARVALAEARE